jgi:peptide/nickel transport system permease protein
MGDSFGALAARRKWLDNTVLPVGYVLTATPYVWLAIIIAWVFGFILNIFPISGGYSYSMEPSWAWGSSGASSPTGSCPSCRCSSSCSGAGRSGCAT